jgi:hypothetical protein
MCYLSRIVTLNPNGPFMEIPSTKTISGSPATRLRVLEETITRVLEETITIEAGLQP